MRSYRPTWIEIDLGALKHNFRQVKRLINAKTKVLVCVKKDAYGHGAVRIAKSLVAQGVDYLGVACIEEAVVLRQNQIKKPILVLGSILSKNSDAVIEYNLTQTLCNKELAYSLNKKARAAKKKVNVHIKVDTGMGRLGVLEKDALEFIRFVKSLEYLNIEGIFTHFPSADSDAKLTRYQIKLFNQLKVRLEKEGIHIPLYHAANSIATVQYSQAQFNMVRPGLMIYGLYPKKGMKVKLKPVLTLKTKVIFLKKVPKHYGISYGQTYRTQKETTIATLPIGYGDGYLRAFSNKADVLIKGKRLRVTGRICMDQIMVDVGNLKVNLGDQVVLIGSQGNKAKITAEELSSLINTIPYEIVCSVGNRIRRIYS